LKNNRFPNDIDIRLKEEELDLSQMFSAIDLKDASEVKIINPLLKLAEESKIE